MKKIVIGYISAILAGTLISNGTVFATTQHVIAIEKSSSYYLNGQLVDRSPYLLYRGESYIQLNTIVNVLQQAGLFVNGTSKELDISILSISTPNPKKLNGKSITSLSTHVKVTKSVIKVWIDGGFNGQISTLLYKGLTYLKLQPFRNELYHSGIKTQWDGNALKYIFKVSNTSNNTSNNTNSLNSLAHLQFMQNVNQADQVIKYAIEVLANKNGNTVLDMIENENTQLNSLYSQVIGWETNTPEDIRVQYDIEGIITILTAITQNDTTTMQNANTNTMVFYLPLSSLNSLDNEIFDLQSDVQADNMGKSSVGFTLYNFERIDSSYTFDQVNNIFGFDGTLTSESGQGTNYDLQTYTWENSSGTKMVTVMFENGFETAKDEVGLN